MTRSLLLITNNPALETTLRELCGATGDYAGCTLTVLPPGDPLPEDSDPDVTLVGITAAAQIETIRVRWPDGWVMLAALPNEADLAAQISAQYGVLAGVSGPAGGSLAGTLRSLLKHGKLDQAPDASPAGTIDTSQVMTERSRVEAALRASETRFKHVAENAPDMIFRWSYAEGFEYVSPASVDVIGYTPEDHYADAGLSYRNIHPEDIPIYESVFSDLADPEGPRRYCIIRWRHREGNTVYVEMRMAPLFDGHGNLIAVDGIARDITQHIVTRERLRELTTRLTQAHEEERQRIAHELHDHIGQALTVAKLRAKMIENSLEEEATLQKLSVLTGLIDEMLHDVRALSRELRPPLLEEMGWLPALELLCDSFGERSGLAVEFDPALDAQRLSPQSELTAYRVVQEALTNAARHAQAELIKVEARMQDDGLRLTISDNGLGFDLVAATGEGAGLGLLGMQERVDTVGGTLQIDSSPGAGTRISIYLPREEGHHAEDYHPAGRRSSSGTGGASGAD